MDMECGVHGKALLASNPYKMVHQLGTNPGESHHAAMRLAVPGLQRGIHKLQRPRIGQFLTDVLPGMLTYQSERAEPFAVTEKGLPILLGKDAYIEKKMKPSTQWVTIAGALWRAGAPWEQKKGDDAGSRNWSRLLYPEDIGKKGFTGVLATADAQETWYGNAVMPLVQMSTWAKPNLGIELTPKLRDLHWAVLSVEGGAGSDAEINDLLSARDPALVICDLPDLWVKVFHFFGFGISCISYDKKTGILSCTCCMTDSCEHICLFITEFRHAMLRHAKVQGASSLSDLPIPDEWIGTSGQRHACM
jgi:hypothetical protein